VNNFNRNPTVTAPAGQTTDEGVLLTFGVSATDADGDHVTLTMLAGSPTGSSFVDNGNNTGTFSWTPGFNQAGSYSVTFRGSDGNGGIGNATTAITVNNVDRAPVADAGGPYTGITGFPVQFHGSGSSDPDGDALSYMWDFGDGGSSTDQDPVHTYTASGLKPVTLTVSSGSPVLSDTDATTATITDTLPARAFTLGGNSKTSLGAGKPFTCFQVEAVGNSFQNSQVLFPTIRMIYPPGTSNMIFASGAKTGIDGDKDGDGVTEITACFAKEDMRVLFAGLPAGNNTVTIEIKGDIVGGGSFSATLEHTVKSNGGVLAASISPNPLNPRAMLSFSTTKPGGIRVQMFDPQGRLVKTIADEPAAMAGYHDYAIDGRSATGTKLASGVYFVKVWSEHDGDEVQRITILK
jgi:PKD repeat protein